MAESSEIIVREVLFGQKDGAHFPITIEIGRPFKWGGTSPTEWVCNLQIDPFFKVRDIHGEGALQPLCLALQLLRSELINFRKEGGVLTWEGGDEFDPDPFWPAEPY
jgi:hypothetical protein